MIGLALALALAAAAMPFAEAPAVEVWASEDWPADTLLAAARLPQATTLNHSLSSRRSPSGVIQVRFVSTANDVTGLPLGV